jgi:hypothetical protein
MSGVELFGFSVQDHYRSYSIYGMQRFASASKLSKAEMISHSYLVYLLILFVLLCFYTLMSYRNLNKQLRWARLLFYIYLSALISLLALASLGFLQKEADQVHLGLGYYLLVIGFPFCYFAFKSIRKDKELLASLDRLR